jgi:xanthine dehydrogenase YagS FAD-binding subunit
VSFAYYRAQDASDALKIAASCTNAIFIAGGTDVMQLCKAGVSSPELVIDISRLPLDTIETRAGGVAIGALARMNDVADHPLIRDGYRALAEALLASASPQVRNVATIGGNLLQRTRCAYFRSNTLPCNKRQPGSGCGALEGENRLHAIFGTSPQCLATHPSDLAVALVALDASVRLRGTSGERTLPIDEFFLLPGLEPARDTVLALGDLIIEVEIPATVWARRSHYRKVRDRASFEFAGVSVAAALLVEDGLIRVARVAAGGVGTKPWRLRHCELALVGEPVSLASLDAAAKRATEGARPLRRNAFKVELLRRTVLRVLRDLTVKELGVDA